MLWTVPNALTWMRIFAIPLVVVLFYMPFPWSDPAAGSLVCHRGYYRHARWLLRA